MNPVKEKNFIPALSFHWLTAAYDPLIRLTLRESLFKEFLMKQAEISGRHTVVDLGCGTATLAIMIKKTSPLAYVLGLDADPEILALARKKAKKENVDIAFQHAMACSLPYRDQTFDRVVSSLMIHHLSTENKMQTFCEIFRVLRNGGEFHLADFGVPKTFLTKAAAMIVRYLEEVGDNIEGRLLTMMQEAGFTDAYETANFSTLFGTLSFYKAKKEIQS